MRKSKLRFLILLMFLQSFTWSFVGESHTSAQVKKTAGEKPASRKTSKTTNDKPKTSTSASIGEFTVQTRYALVIGNSSYPGILLPNTINDSALIAKSLRLLNFNVTEKKNLTLVEMRGAIEDFSRKLPADAVGMFFLLDTDFK